MAQPQFASRVSGEPGSDPIKGDSFNVRSRDSLESTASKATFSLTMREGASSQWPSIKGSIAPGETEQLVHLETGEDTPYTPPLGRNWLKTKMWGSVDTAARLDVIVDGDLLFDVYLDGGDWTAEQEAGMIELVELVDDLDGTHTISFEVTNLSDVDLEGTVFIRALEVEA